MASFNKIMIVGYLGKDPELRYTPQGKAVANFSIATTERRKDGGEDKEITTWFRVSVWGRQAELCNEYLTKGRQVYVEGRLCQTEYTDREGGTRTALEVNASDVQFLSPKGEGGGISEPNRSNGPAERHPQSTIGRPANDQGSKNGGNEIVDEDIPF